MATIYISGGTTSAGLIAGASATGAPWQIISVTQSASAGGAPGEIDDFIELTQT